MTAANDPTPLGPRPAVPAEMRRCTICGTRLASPDGPCPVHGDATWDSASAPSYRSLATAPPPPVPGYVMGHEIGRGGFGSVYMATRARDGMRVAIKVAHPVPVEAKARLQREAKVLAAIGAPFVPQLFDAGTLADGGYFIAMEHLTAPTLAQILARRGAALGVDEALHLAGGLLRALEGAHARGILPRDLKPENTFVHEQAGPVVAAVRLVDFGLARAPHSGMTELSLANDILGSPEYMAPEQCEGRRDVDERADIYSFAVVLYELLCGRPPFIGSPADVRAAHSNVRPPPPSRWIALAEPVENVLLRCLSKRRSSRYPTASELVDALVAARSANATDAPSKPAEPSDKARPRVASRRRRAAVVFFECAAEAVRVSDALSRFGGQLAHVHGPRHAAVFDHTAGENPVRRAERAARTLVASDITAAAAIDLLEVVAQPRSNGATRFLSREFSQAHRYPPSSAASGVALSDAAAAVLGQLPDSAPIPATDETLAERNQTPTPSSGDRGWSGPLLGRDHELAGLVAHARTSASRAVPSIATIIGDPGYGKSHLCSALVDALMAFDNPCQLVHLRIPEPIDGSGARSLRLLLTRLLGLSDDASAAAALERIATWLGAERARELWSSLAVVVGWASSESTEARALVAAPGALRAGAARAVGSLLRCAAGRCPLLVVIDDAHFADEVTLDALEFAALDEAGAPLWVCVSARPTFAQTRPTWAARAGARHDVGLAPLPADAAAELARQLLAPVQDVPAAVLRRLIDRAERVPMLLVELIRGLRAEGFVRQSSTTGAWQIATDELERLPDLPLLQWRARRGLEALAPALAAHARLLSVLGREFRICEVKGLLRQLDRRDTAGLEFPLDAEVGTRRLSEAGFIVRHGQDCLAFRTDLIRDAIYATVDDPVRLELHRAAFDHYDTPQCGLADDYRLPRLALHAAQCGLRERAKDLYFVLARRAETRHAYLDAELLYSRTLHQIEAVDDPLTLAAQRGIAQMRFRLGRYDDALLGTQRALALASQHHDDQARFALLLDEATIYDWMNNYAASLARVEAAETLASIGLSRLLRARLMLAQGRALWRFGHGAEGLPLLHEAAALANDVGADGHETAVVARLLTASIEIGLGRIDAAGASFSRVIAQCEAHGDVQHLAAALNNRRELWAGRGDLDRAIADQTRAQQIGRELGQPAIEYGTSHNLAELLYYAGDVVAAEPLARRAAELETHSSQRPLAVLLRARIAVVAGDVELAARLIAEIKDSHRAARARADSGALFMAGEQVLADMAELATVPFDRGAWAELCARSAEYSLPWERLEVLDVMGRCALRADDAALASECLATALSVARSHPHLIAGRIRHAWRQAQRALGGVAAAPTALGSVESTGASA
jgi:eukaryotic-like serine/threonine-protein kinase